jgi:cytochrome c
VQDVSPGRPADEDSEVMAPSKRPGSLPDIKYSKALVAFGQDKVWDEATLTIFLRDPQGVVKGTKMAFFGLQKDEEIKAVIAYLATFDKGGMAPK